MIICKLKNFQFSSSFKAISFIFMRPISLVNSSILLPICTRNSSTFCCKSENDDEKAYIVLLRKCIETSDLYKAKSIHAKLIKKRRIGASSMLFVRNNLMNVYLKCGDIENGLQLFDEMPQKNVVSWTALIAGFVQNGFPVDAFSLFSRMHLSGIKPNEFTFVSALHACAFADYLSVVHALQVYGLIVKLGFVSNVYLANAFLTVLMRHCRLNEALKVFEECSQKDIVSWNAIMGGYLLFSSGEIPGLWHHMNLEGVKPDGFTFATVLTGLAELLDLEMGAQVHARLVKSGHGSEMCVGNALVDMYLKNRKLVDGFKAFEEIPVRDVCSWTQMSAGCLNCGEPREALNVIEEMRRKGVKPNKFTLATTLNACANLASLEEGEKVHGLRVKLEEDVDVCVDNALLDMYAKCGCMDGALKVFRSMDVSTVVSWTSMIIGYAQNGHAREALQIFDEMTLKGVKPNYITLICVLYACNQGGFVDEGKRYFASMHSYYGIEPGEDHYACMVSLLGRAGYIKEAEDLIREMPFEPSLLVWQTLLGACRLNGDMETAKRAAEYALNLDKTDSSTYVLLSNTLASLNNWDGVGMLREVMSGWDVNKMPGSSWIELSRDHSLSRANAGSV